MIPSFPYCHHFDDDNGACARCGDKVSGDDELILFDEGLNCAACAERLIAHEEYEAVE